MVWWDVMASDQCSSKNESNNTHRNMWSWPSTRHGHLEVSTPRFCTRSACGWSSWDRNRCVRCCFCTPHSPSLSETYTVELIDHAWLLQERLDREKRLSVLTVLSINEKSKMFKSTNQVSVDKRCEKCGAMQPSHPNQRRFCWYQPLWTWITCMNHHMFNTMT